MDGMEQAVSWLNKAFENCRYGYKFVRALLLMSFGGPSNFSDEVFDALTPLAWV